MKKNNVRKNYIYNVIYQIIAIIIPIITTPYLSRVLGAKNIGIYGYTISISAYFILFGSLGINLYGQREIAFNQSDSKKYSKSFYEILLLKLITMIISTILFYFIFVRGNNDYNLYYKILLLELFANIIDISWLFQGLEEFKKTVTRNLIVKVVGLICIFIFIKTKNDLNIYLLIYALSILLGNLSLWFYLPKYLKKVSIIDLNLLRHLKPTLIMFLPQIAIQIYTVLDRTMIGNLILDKSEVGFYTQGEKIVKLLLTIITSLGTVMLPRIASKFAEKDHEKIKEYINKSFNFVYLLSFPMIFGIISVSRSFVPIFFGQGYDRVVYVMITLSPIILFIGLSNVIGIQYLLPTMHQKEYTISVIVGAFINFGINLVLIPKYGAIGAAIGTIIAEFFVTFVQIICVRKNFSIIKIITMSFPYLFGALIMFIVLYFVRRIEVSNFLSVIIQLMTGVAVYGLYLLITRNKFVFEYIDAILRKLKKQK